MPESDADAAVQRGWGARGSSSSAASISSRERPVRVCPAPWDVGASCLCRLLSPHRFRLSCSEHLLQDVMVRLEVLERAERGEAERACHVLGDLQIGAELALADAARSERENRAAEVAVEREDVS